MRVSGSGSEAQLPFDVGKHVGGLGNLNVSMLPNLAALHWLNRYGQLLRQGMPTSQSWSWECDLDVLLRYLWQWGTLVIRWDWHLGIVGRCLSPEINGGKACQ